MSKKRSFSLKKGLRIYQFIKPYKNLFFFGVFILFLSSITTMLFPSLLGDIIDEANNASEDGVNKLTLSLLVVFFANAIFSFFRIYIFSVVTQKSLAEIRNKAYKQLITSPMLFFSQRRVGELSSRVAADISLLQETYSTTTAEFLRQFITIPVGVGFLFFISPRLTLFMLAVIPLVAAIGVFFGRFIKNLSKEAQDEIANANTILEETLQAIVSVKAYANEFFEMFRYKKSIDNVVKTSLKRAFWRGLFIATIMFFAAAAIIAIIWYGLHMVQNNVITIGELFKFIIYSAMLGFSFGGLAELFAQIQKAIGATEDLMDIIEQKTEPVELTPHKNIPVKGEIEFKKVAFAYPNRRDIEVLKNISFKVNEGQQIAIVGPSGAGKSTIVSLLFRFYDPDEGEILIDNENIKNYNLSEIRNQMAYVPQELLLFGGTIKENIAYGKPDATEDEIFEAAKKANALEFIEKFPEKFDTIVGERGVQLSGGQRQRIAIARAILKNPKILVLDEATSALDSDSERLVQQALDKLMVGRTSIVIAHRLSTIKNADKIIVLDNGIIKESGTHNELVKKEDGIYKNLSNIQLTAV